MAASPPQAPRRRRPPAGQLSQGQKYLRGGFLLFAFLLVCFSYYFYQVFFTSNIATDGKRVVVRIHPGQGYRATMDSIEATGAIVDKLSFNFVAKLKHYDEHVKPGLYELTEGLTNLQLINRLRAGEQTPVKFTIRPVRLRRLLTARLDREFAGRRGEFDSLLRDPAFVKSLDLGLDTTTVISLFLPDTYEAWWTTPPVSVIQKMKSAYERYWTPERRAKADELGLTLAQVSTLAAIVQGEQQLHVDEQPRIAGVYLNRLRRGMLLQADPTVVYAVGSRTGDFMIRRVTGEMLKTDSPYNTYRVKGLPPGPIMIPTKGALNAVLNAEDHKYLYFCAKEDFSGYHNFAATPAEHQANARRYRTALDQKGIH
jgi:UPF0755 protein